MKKNTLELKFPSSVPHLETREAGYQKLEKVIMLSSPQMGHGLTEIDRILNSNLPAVGRERNPY